MLISPRSEPPLALIGMSYNDIRSDRSQQTNNSLLIPPNQLPKHFNVTYAIQHGYFRCVRYLLELSYDPNERDQQLRTPLILCSYVENDRWSLSLAQNLLEKGAKIALEDHARRNAMHHACALQRIHLVQLYLTCLDFKIESKDCEGNTCLHYVAITGNCEIAELLIKTAEKMGTRLDQCLNREGCSAAVLALKYGHIECANQITHRDWDEFFVIPRPLSIYETPPTPDANHPLSTTTNPTILKKKSKVSPPQATSTAKSDIRPSALSFGLLKIIFNESDSSYSTRLAGLCNEKKSSQRRRRVRIKKHQENQINHPQSGHYCSTEALINEIRTSTLDDRGQLHSVETDDGSVLVRTSPRMQLLIQQHGIPEEKSNLSLNYIEPAVSVLYESPRTKSRLQRPKTVVVTRNQNSVNAVGIPSRLSSPKLPPKRSLLHNRPNSASIIPKPHFTHLTSEATTYSQTLYNGRPLSAVLHSQHPRHPPAQRTVDSSCTIREAKGTANRYNNPEELFGLKPEELFGRTDHQPKIINTRKALDYSRLNSRPAHVWQDDIDKLIDLYNIHQSSNYRKTAVPPPPPVNPPVDTLHDLPQTGKTRTNLANRHSSNSSRTRSPTVSKQSTFSTITIPRRNSVSQRPTIKLTNA